VERTVTAVLNHRRAFSSNLKANRSRWHSGSANRFGHRISTVPQQASSKSFLWRFTSNS